MTIETAQKARQLLQRKEALEQILAIIDSGEGFRVSAVFKRVVPRVRNELPLALAIDDPDVRQAVINYIRDSLRCVTSELNALTSAPALTVGQNVVAIRLVREYGEFETTDNLYIRLPDDMVQPDIRPTTETILRQRIGMYLATKDGWKANAAVGKNYSWDDMMSDIGTFAEYGIYNDVPNEKVYLQYAPDLRVYHSENLAPIDVRCDVLFLDKDANPLFQSKASISFQSGLVRSFDNSDFPMDLEENTDRAYAVTPSGDAIPVRKEIDDYDGSEGIYLSTDL